MSDINPLAGLTPKQLDELRASAVNDTIATSNLEKRRDELKRLTKRAVDLAKELSSAQAQRASAEAELRTTLLDLFAAGLTPSQLVKPSGKAADWLIKLRRYPDGLPAKKSKRSTRRPAKGAAADLAPLAGSATAPSEAPDSPFDAPGFAAGV
jgi:hypothetical protein